MGGSTEKKKRGGTKRWGDIPFLEKDKKFLSSSTQDGSWETRYGHIIQHDVDQPVKENHLSTRTRPCAISHSIFTNLGVETRTFRIINL